MKKFTLIFFAFYFSFFTLRAQSWNWGKQGMGSAEGYSVATNTNRDCFFAGYFYDTLNFGTYKLNSLYNSRIYYDAYLVRYDKSGNVRWAVQTYTQSTHSNVSAQCFSVVADMYGNSFITGFFNDTIKLGSFILTQTNTHEMFIAKIDSNGTVLWAKQSGGYVLSYAEGHSITVDKTGNTYVTGYFDDTVKWGTYTLSSPNHTNSFLIKYDTIGNVVWAKQSNTMTGTSYAYGVTIDKEGNPIITGGFYDTISFGSNLLTSKNGVSTAFIVKYDSTGNVKWAGQAKTFSVCHNLGYSLALDNDGNSYTTGVFTDTVILANDTLISTTGDIFLTKYDSNGKGLWAKAAKVLDNGWWYGFSLAINDSNRLYMTGGKVDNSPNSKMEFGNITLSLNNTLDASVVIEFDSSGKALCGSILPTGGDDNNSIACDPSGKYIYYGADAEADTLIFGLDTLFYPSGEYPFIACWQSCSEEAGLNEPIDDNISVEIYPNPFESVCYIKLPANVQKLTPQFSLFSIDGRKVKPSISYSDNIYLLNKAELSLGVYILSIKYGNQVLNKKIVLIK